MSSAVAVTATNNGQTRNDAQGINIQRLSYAFPGGQTVMKDFTMNLPMGSRTLLLGCNGAGTHLSTS